MRYPITTTGTHFIAIDGTKFFLNEREKMEAHSLAYIERAEKLAGRKLSLRELQNGIDHYEDRRVADRIETLREQPTPSGNPYKQLLDAPRGEMTYRQHLKNQAEQWDREQAEVKEKAAFESNPDRIAAMTAAKAELNEMKFDPRIPMSQLVAAQKRLDIASNGDIATYKEQAAAWQAEKKAAAEAHNSAIDKQIEGLNESKI